MNPLESDECKVFHRWLKLKNIPHTHIANESGGNTQQARIRGMKMKQMGTAKGVWDYEIFVPIKGITGNVDAYQQIKIEMKRRKGNKPTPEQKEWGDIYEKAGIPCKVCYGADDAIEFVSSFCYN